MEEAQRKSLLATLETERNRIAARIRMGYLGIQEGAAMLEEADQLIAAYQPGAFAAVDPRPSAPPLATTPSTVVKLTRPSAQPTNHGSNLSNRASWPQAKRDAYRKRQDALRARGMAALARNKRSADAPAALFAGLMRNGRTALGMAMPSGMSELFPSMRPGRLADATRLAARVRALIGSGRNA